MSAWTPVVEELADGHVRLGHPLVDDYLELVLARCRRNTLLATAYDLKVFFTVVGKDPAVVESADVLRFVKEQRRPRPGRMIVPIDGGGLALSTVKRRLSSISGLYGFLVARGDLARTPVLHTISTRARGRGQRGVPLVRAVRQLPRILLPEEVNALMGALRKWRDRAMVEAMVLGGLRRAEVLGLRLEDLRTGDRRVFVAEGKGGHQRLAPMSGRFFASVAHYLDAERPAASGSDRVFVVLKGQHRGEPLTPKGLEQILTSARERAGLDHATCHELRHTCLTRLREAGMALEAVQAQAGHRSIESTRLYLHLANDWLAGEYHKAAQLIDAATATGAST